jgi:hypothetical protein
VLSSIVQSSFVITHQPRRERARRFARGSQPIREVRDNCLDHLVRYLTGILVAKLGPDPGSGGSQKRIGQVVQGELLH